MPRSDAETRAYFDVWRAKLRDDRTQIVAGDLEPLRFVRAWRIAVLVLLALGVGLLAGLYHERIATRRALDAQNAREALTHDRANERDRQGD